MAQARQAHHAHGIVAEGARSARHKAPRAQVGEAAAGVDQGARRRTRVARRHVGRRGAWRRVGRRGAWRRVGRRGARPFARRQRPCHGIDGEVAAAQVVGDGGAAQRGHVDVAALADDPPGREALRVGEGGRVERRGQGAGEALGVAGHRQVDVVALAVQQPVAHGAAHEPGAAARGGGRRGGGGDGVGIEHALRRRQAESGGPSSGGVVAERTPGAGVAAGTRETAVTCAASDVTGAST